MPSPVISALSLSQALYDRSANSPVVSRGLDLSLKSMTHPLGLFGSVTAGGQISPPTAISTTAIQTAALNLASVGCLPLGGHGNLSNGISHQLEASGEDENDNGSFDECSDYSNDSPVDIESTTTSNKSALDCLMGKLELLFCRTHTPKKYSFSVVLEYNQSSISLFSNIYCVVFAV